jgi:hypothetical protein
VALSSCEAEIVAASEAAKEAVYLRGFLRELGEHDDSPIEVRMDNKAARDLAYNPEHHEKTKHIDRRHFFVREQVEEGTIVVPYVNTHDNIADFFTKPLPKSAFRAFRDVIMNVPVDLFQSGRCQSGVALSATGGVLDGAPPTGCVIVDWSVT